MELQLNMSIVKHLPSSLKVGLSKLEPAKQTIFEEEYKRDMKDPTLILILSICFPIHYFLLGRVGLGIIYWMSFGGMGFWYAWDIITIYSRTKRDNGEIGKRVLRDMKLMGI